MGLNHDEMSVFTGQSPIAAPFTMLICQVCIVITVARVFGELARFVKQPKVVGEIFAGLLMGPSLLGNIDWWSSTIFPAKSLANLRLFSEFGLVFYMFMVGCEMDMTMVKSNLKNATLISSICIIIPFAAGVALAPLYWHVIDDDPTMNVSFWPFAIFTGVAMSITAFPIQARIITQMGMTYDVVGVTVLSAAALDDVVAWCLLALVTALVTATNPMTFVWVCVSTTGFVLISMLAVQPLLERALKWHYNRGGKLSLNLVAASCVFALLGAWITRAFGINAIFGAFIAGAALPRHANFSYQVMAKIEDFVLAVLLPLYFAFTGLRTKVNSISSAESVGLMILACVVATLSKFIPGAGMARFLGFPWRESVTVGILMNCKALIELIALNAGLDAGAINTAFFTMFVLMALWTTAITFPVISYTYPLSYRQARDAKNMTSASGDGDVSTAEDLKKLSEKELNIAVPFYSSVDAQPVVDFLSAAYGGSEQKGAVTALRLREVDDRTTGLVNAQHNSSVGIIDAEFELFSSKCQTVGLEARLHSTPFTHDGVVADVATTLNNITPVPDMFVAPWSARSSDVQVHNALTPDLLSSALSIIPQRVGVFVPSAHPTAAAAPKTGQIVVVSFGTDFERDTVVQALRLANRAGVTCHVLACTDPTSANSNGEDRPPSPKTKDNLHETNQSHPHSLDVDSHENLPTLVDTQFMQTVGELAVNSNGRVVLTKIAASSLPDKLQSLIGDVDVPVRLVVCSTSVPVWVQRTMESHVTAATSQSHVGGDHGNRKKVLGHAGALVCAAAPSIPLLCVRHTLTQARANASGDV